MKITTKHTQEPTEERQIEAIQQLKLIALGEGPATCQICDRKLREGDKLTAYAFRGLATQFLTSDT